MLVCKYSFNAHWLLLIFFANYYEVGLAGGVEEEYKQGWGEAPRMDWWCQYSMGWGIIHGPKDQSKERKLDQRAVPNLFNLISQEYFKDNVWRLTIIFYKDVNKSNMMCYLHFINKMTFISVKCRKHMRKNPFL